MEHRPQEVHSFQRTILGRCLRCSRTELEHVAYLPQPDPLTECSVDHASIHTGILIDDGGLVWHRCPFCNVMVEGAMRIGVLPGPECGPGRGSIAPRVLARLKAWVGWTDFNGGR